MQLQSGTQLGLMKTDAGFNLSIRLGNSFMSANLTRDELDLFAGHIVAELMNGTKNEVTVYGSSFSLVEDDLDIVQPPEESAAYRETRAAIDTAEMATK